MAQKSVKKYCKCHASNAVLVDKTWECTICNLPKKKSKLVAMCGWKYEPEWMIEDMKKNMHWVDDFVILDCRDRDELWMHEGQYRLTLREMARKKGADWVLVCAPDERYEKNAGDIIRPLIDYNNEDKMYAFQLWELFHPMWYRVDGIWGNKARRRLYPLKDNQHMAFCSIQCPPVPVTGLERFDIDVYIYHLKMIEPENRAMRTKVFNILDPKKKFQGVGYDYLNDEKEAEMKRIDEGREYYPKYKKYIFSVPDEYLVEPEPEPEKEIVEENEPKEE